MTNDLDIIRQTLQRPAQYRLTLDSAENCIKAHVNPITGRHLITEEQASALHGTLEQVRSENPHGTDRELLAVFAPQAVAYLRSTDSKTSRQAAQDEFTAEVKGHYTQHTEIKYQPHGTPKDERNGNQRNRQWRTRSVEAQGAMRALYFELEKLKSTYKLTNEQLGLACIGPRTGEPLSPEAMNTAFSVLRKGDRVSSAFRYITNAPDMFFETLERTMERRPDYTLITAEDRTSLIAAVDAALLQAQAQRPGSRGR